MAARDIIQAAAGAAGATEANYIEDVFSTYLYAGTGASRTINNGIDLATKGGMVWTKGRDYASDGVLTDTARPPSGYLDTTATNAAGSDSSMFSAFTTSGFTVGGGYNTNYSGKSLVSWTFRKQPKFFDIVTYTGNGVAGRQIAHSLGVTPGMIIVKRTDTPSEWVVYHKGLTSASYYVMLHSTSAEASSSTIWNSTAPTSSVFSVGINSTVNVSGGTYVAYLFADSNSGGFGPAGTDSVVACGSFTTASNGLASVNLGWEPQYVLIKSSSRAGSNWIITDNMRGMTRDSNSSVLYAENSNAEYTTATTVVPRPSSTGFDFNWVNGALGVDTFIYLAIRRGPMKTPTDATKVYSVTKTDYSTIGDTITTNFPVDMVITGMRGGNGSPQYVEDRLRGVHTTALYNDTGSYPYLSTASNTADTSQTWGLKQAFNNTGFSLRALGSISQVFWSFRRAPGFFDVVCYTGTGSATTVAHNLGVAPELMIVKSRSSGPASPFWAVYAASQGNTAYAQLNSTSAFGVGVTVLWNSTSPTASNFTVGTYSAVNNSSSTYVAYLFATCPGVSKVGSYTGTGSAQNIDCGFAAGARFVLIKNASSNGSWWVFDTARGISSVGADPVLQLNSAQAEDAYDWLNAYSGGFGLNSSTLNDSGATFIYLAIA